MSPSPTQIERAKKKEQWVLRTEAAEDPAAVLQDLGLPYRASYLRHLRTRYEQGGQSWESFLDQRHRWATKGTLAVKALLSEKKQAQPDLTGPELRRLVWDELHIDISITRLKELLHAANLSNPPGRPPKRGKVTQETPPRTERELDNAGLFFPQRGVPGTGYPGAG